MSGPDGCEVWVGTQTAGTCPPGRGAGHRPASWSRWSSTTICSGAGSAGAWSMTASPWRRGWRSRWTGRCRWCGAAKRTSATTRTAISTGAGSRSGSVPTACPSRWQHRVVGPAIMARFLADPVQGRHRSRYHRRCGEPLATSRTSGWRYVRHEAPEGMLTGNWRGVGPTRNAPAVEGGIDEAAHLAGRDPVEYRRQLLGRRRGCAVRWIWPPSSSGWGTPIGPDRGRGVALLADFGSFAALVAQVHVGRDGTLTLERMVCAVDCGQIINPGSCGSRSERDHLRPERRAVRPPHHRRRRRRRGQLRRGRAGASHQRMPADRGPYRPERRGAGRNWRGRHAGVAPP